MGAVGEPGILLCLWVSESEGERERVETERGKRERGKRAKGGRERHESMKNGGGN